MDPWKRNSARAIRTPRCVVAPSSQRASRSGSCSHIWCGFRSRRLCMVVESARDVVAHWAAR